jgi:hypothetical protein
MTVSGIGARVACKPIAVRLGARNSKGPHLPVQRGTTSFPSLEVEEAPLSGRSPRSDSVPIRLGRIAGEGILPYGKRSG